MAFQLNDDQIRRYQQGFAQTQPQTPASTAKAPGVGSFLLGLLPGGSLIDKGMRGEQITGGDVAMEALLSAVPFGLGKVAKGVKGAFTAGKTALNARKLGRGADILQSTKGKTIGQIQDATQPKFLTDYERARNAGDELAMRKIQLAHPGDARVNIDDLSAVPTPPKEMGGIAGGLLRQSTISPMSTLKTASEQRKLVDLARSLPGMRGSASRKFQKVEGEIGKMTNQVDDLLKGVTTKKPFADLDARASEINSLIPDPTEQKRFANEFRTIINNTFKGKIPTDLNATDISKLRRSVNSQLTGTFKKINAGTQLTDKDEALLKLRDTFGETLEELAPKAVTGQVKSLNKNMSTLMSGIPEFKKASEEGLQILGTRVPFVSQKIPQIFQAGADMAGRTLTNPIANPLLQQAGVRVGADVLGLRKPPQADAMAQPGIDDANTDPTLANADNPALAALTSGGDAGLPSAGSPQSMYSRESAAKDIQNDLQRTGGANMDKYLKLYEFMNPESKLSAADQKQQKQTMQVNNILDQLEGGLTGLGGGRGVAGYLGQAGNILTRGAVDPQQATYDALRGGITSKLARSLGEVGTLTDQDIQRALSLIPAATDAPQAAAMKMAQLRALVNSGNTGGGEGENILAALQQAGAY